MKKQLFLMCLSAITLVMSAQTSDTYQMHVNLKDGTVHYSTDAIQEIQFVHKLSADNPATQEGQPVTDSYTAISVSGLATDFANATVADGRSEVTIRLSGITLQAVGGTTPANDDDGYPCVRADGTVWKWNDVNWDEKRQNDIDFYYILGTGNPYTALHAEEIVTEGTSTGHYRASYDYYQPDGSKGMPVSGLYYKFSPKYDGVLKVGVWSNKNNRNTYVVEESSMLPVAYQAEGYINGQNDASGKKRLLSNEDITSLHDAAGVGPYVIGTGNFFWGWITVNVEAGKTYWLFQDSSQIGFQDFTFTYTADGSGTDDDSTDYLMTIIQKAGEVSIATDNVVEITFDKEADTPVSAGSTVLDETISAIPAEYTARAERRGQVVGVNYTTTSYDNGQQVEKTAYVYLPWEYDYYPDRRYNILYLMHGMGDDATTYIYGNTKELRMAIDHMIQDGIIEPLIVVTPTFYAPGAGNDNIFQAAASFPGELLNDLMPVVESRYRTYALDANREDFKASRNHRAFGGFSMGSATTWNVFSQALPYIRDFIPMSGGGSANASSLANIVNQAGLGAHDFYINAMSGSDDYAASGLASQISQMASQPPFILNRDREQGNIYYREWPGGQHDYRACITYVYNALHNLFK